MNPVLSNIYSIPYLALALFFLIVFVIQNSLKLTEKTTLYINATVPIAFLFFFGFRGFIGWDWFNYYPFYNGLPNIFHLNQFENKSLFDIGFVISSSLIKTFFTNYHTFIFINTLIDVLLLHIFFKRYLNEKYYAFGFAVFLVFFGLLMEIDLMRNIKALLLFLMSLKYIENRSPVKYFSLIVVAILFHWSAIVFIPLYFFLHKRIPIIAIIIVVCIGNIIYIFQFEYIKPIILFFSSLARGVAAEKITSYLTDPMFTSSYGLTFGHLERLFSTFLFLLYYEKIISSGKKNILFINAFFIYLIIYLFLSEINILISRLGNLFSFSYWILWPKIIDILHSKINKQILILLFVCLILLKTTLFTNNIMYKYDNLIFNKISKFEERLKVYKKHSKTLENRK
jgi:hypothetical protein